MSAEDRPAEHRRFLHVGPPSQRGPEQDAQIVAALERVAAQLARTQRVLDSYIEDVRTTANDGSENHAPDPPATRSTAVPTKPVDHVRRRHGVAGTRAPGRRQRRTSD